MFTKDTTAKMDYKFQRRIQRRLYHSSEMASFSPSLPLTETTVEYFQDSFLGSEGLGRLDMAMAANVTKRNQVSPCSMVVSMLYAKRLRQRNQQYLQSMSSTDVFFISMMMASKYLYDEGIEEEVYNDEWAESVGHDVDEVNKMEMDFLREMDWQLFIKPQEFDQALTAIERRLALKEGVNRGWLTYTELAVLLDWEPMYQLWKQVGRDCTKVVSLLSAVYVASLVSMMGSAAVAIHLSGPLATATVAVLSTFHHVSSSIGGPSHTAPFQPLLSSPSTVDNAIILNNTIDTTVILPMLMTMSVTSLRLQNDISVGTGNSENHIGNRSSGAMEEGLRSSNNAGLQTKTASSSGNEVSNNRTAPGCHLAGRSDVREKEGESFIDYKVVKGGRSYFSRVKQVSLLSLCLLDSFISQVVSVFSRRVGAKDNGGHCSGGGVDHPDGPSSHFPSCHPQGSQKSHGCLCGDGKKSDKHVRHGRRRHCHHEDKGQHSTSQTQSSIPSKFRFESISDRLTTTDFVSPVINRVDHKQHYGDEGLTANYGASKLGNHPCRKCDLNPQRNEYDRTSHGSGIHHHWSQSFQSWLPSCLNKLDCADDLQYKDMNHRVARHVDVSVELSPLDVPIQDPVGFFTSFNTEPVYVLST